MEDKPLIILGSARKNSETKNFLNKVFNEADYKLVDLLDFNINPYNYSNQYPESDDFLRIINEIIFHKNIVFATPVYWYAMSGLLKNFFDRFTDIVTTQKNLGRGMKGKFTFLLAVGSDEELPPGFEIPFELTSAYLDMIYKGCIYSSTKIKKGEEKIRKEIELFKNKIYHH